MGNGFEEGKANHLYLNDGWGTFTEDTSSALTNYRDSTVAVAFAHPGAYILHVEVVRVRADRHGRRDDDDDRRDDDRPRRSNIPPRVGSEKADITDARGVSRLRSPRARRLFRD